MTQEEWRRALRIWLLIWAVEAIGIGFIAGLIAWRVPSLRLFALGLFVVLVLVLFPLVIAISLPPARPRAAASADAQRAEVGEGTTGDPETAGTPQPPAGTT